MSAVALASFEPHYVRDINRDVEISQATSILKRIGIAALPFFEMQGSLKHPIALGCGLARVKTSLDKKDYCGVFFSVVSVAGGFFNHKKSLFITCAHDLYLNLSDFIKGSDGNRALLTLKIVKQTLFLATLAYGGSEILLLSSLIQCLIHTFDSYGEFEKGRWIEGFSKLLLAGLEGRNTYKKIHHYKKEREIKQRLKGHCVGILGAKWKLPSDHLPIGVTVNGVKIYSWNVLNNHYLSWVTNKNSQGINGSLVTELDQQDLNYPTLTQREVLVADMVTEMGRSGDIIALQECRPEFLAHLESKMKGDFELASPYEKTARNQEVVFYRTSALTLAESDQRETYPCRKDKLLQSFLFKTESQDELRVLNLHIPGDPKMPGKKETAEYLWRQSLEKRVPCVAIGDNNFTRDEMIEAYKEAGFREFSVHTPNLSNIDPTSKESKGIDHAFVAYATSSQDLEIPDLPGFKETLSLLLPSH